MVTVRVTSKLEDEIECLEAERARIEKRTQKINETLKEKYKAWHAEQFARRQK